MRRETAYKIAIEAMTEKRRRECAFDHNIGLMYPAAINEKATKKYQRITEAISVLEAERDHKQMELFTQDKATEGRG